MKNVGPTRVELGTRTIFNLLGPLSNPAGVRRQMVGVFSRQWVEPLAHVLKNLGSESIWVVHGSDGLDEITITGPTYVAALEKGAVRTFEITPEEVGFARQKPEALRGGDAAHNAKALLDVLKGVKGPFRDVALLNAAAGLVVAGHAKDLQQGVEQAAKSVDSGAAKACLDRELELGGRLVVTVEVRRREVDPGRAQHFDLAPRDDVEAQPLLGDEPRERSVEERLRGVEHLGVGLDGAEPIDVGATLCAQRGGVIHVQRRAVLRRELGRVDSPEREPPVAGQRCRDRQDVREGHGLRVGGCHVKPPRRAECDFIRGAPALTAALPQQLWHGLCRRDQQPPRRCRRCAPRPRWSAPASSARSRSTQG